MNSLKPGKLKPKNSLIKIKVISFKLNVDLYRNGIKEAIIFSNKSTEIAAFLKGIVPKDYFEYMDFYNMKEPPHLVDWITEVKNVTEDTELFKGAIVIANV